ncbi:universal stress protein [Nibribacter ruber]|uniref:Universal stress protein n=1 Tax=Nibribacter ruber TaxID=2698458 RepID=A0A6P1NVL3_9BACT|nr:universal stress protein [Nibribacter ruber]QHL86018.1 universal stress protein [Nibribacter ruber]
MKAILVPTDFSDNARNAIQFAAAIARKTQAKLIMAHIIHLPVAPIESGLVMPPDMQLEEEFSKELEMAAQNLRAEYQDQFAIETICQYGYLTGDLNELVKTHGVDLVVMGTKGATNFLDSLIGTNAAEFSKSAHCPVLMIPGVAQYQDIQHIAYASDFVSDEHVFLPQLSQLAQAFGARVSIVNVVGEGEETSGKDGHQLQELLGQFPQLSCCVAQIRDKDIVHGLHDFVEQNQADVLAVSMHKRGFFDDLFHSSVTKQLMHHTTVPLLTLPEKPYRLAPSSSQA